MAIFLDTGFYLGLVHPKDDNYDKSQQLLKTLKTGIYGQLYTSNFIMAESATLVATRTGKNIQAMQNIQELFFGSGQIAIILRLNDVVERDAWDIFQKINNKKSDDVVSYVDCTNIALCCYYSIENILSYDSHFDGWITRIF